MKITACATRFAFLAVAGIAAAQDYHPVIPRAWEDKEVQGFELPLVQRDRSPRYMSAEDYYKLRVRKVYRSYPTYVEGKEPPGYIESLKQKEPEVIFDASQLRTKEDWIRAGKVVFEAENSFFPAVTTPGGRQVSPATAPYVSRDGTLPISLIGSSYIIRQKGVLEAGSNSCAGCHTRLMPDGSFLAGAQGNFPNPRIAPPANASPERLKQLMDTRWVLFGAPWIQTREDFEKEVGGLAPARPYPVVIGRQGSSASHLARIPSLIGIADIKYLDATGLVRHRSIGDLMRYAIINEGLDTLAHFGDFQPTKGVTSFSAEEGTRFSDEQLYALALYLESLQPPANPNSFDERARRGEQIFAQQGCAGCHTPPLYTNNKLTPARGFVVPDDLLKTERILNVPVGTDQTLAMKTRRGTGFYKVPSLRGVWFRNGFGHDGQADTLEEWLDSARLKDDYVPNGYHRGPGPIKGHEFGLRLTLEERQNLIAFLRTF
jgi:hypothetical protein